MMSTYIIINGEKIVVNDMDFQPQNGMVVEYEGKTYQVRHKYIIRKVGQTADITQEAYLE